MIRFHPFPISLFPYSVIVTTRVDKFEIQNNRYGCFDNPSPSLFTRIPGNRIISDLEKDQISNDS